MIKYFIQNSLSEMVFDYFLISINCFAHFINSLCRDYFHDYSICFQRYESLVQPKISTNFCIFLLIFYFIHTYAVVKSLNILFPLMTKRMRKKNRKYKNKQNHWSSKECITKINRLPWWWWSCYCFVIGIAIGAGTGSK